jgi:hypothetical protein
VLVGCGEKATAQSRRVQNDKVTSNHPPRHAKSGAMYRYILARVESTLAVLHSTPITATLEKTGKWRTPWRDDKTRIK